MTSKEINDKISELDLLENKIYESCIGGKIIPYIGWFWRNVDWDKERYWLGILEDEDEVKIGFMENNKWDYAYVEASPEKCKEIKEAILIALDSLNPNDFKIIDDLIQGLKQSL
jgi:hypothetical protein